MTTYIVRYEVVVEADNTIEAEQLARERLSDPNFEPVLIGELREDIEE